MESPESEKMISSQLVRFNVLFVFFSRQKHRLMVFVWIYSSIFFRYAVCALFIFFRLHYNLISGSNERKHLECSYFLLVQMKWRAFSIHTFRSNKRRTTETMNKYIQQWRIKNWNTSSECVLYAPVHVRVKSMERVKRLWPKSSIAHGLRPILLELWIK